MNRDDFQKLTDLRIKEAKILLANGEYAGAYYLAGYSVECALKSCIAKQIHQHEFPDRKFILDSYTHSLEVLLNNSGLKKTLEDERRKNFTLNGYWSNIKDWTVGSRYSCDINKKKAEDLLEAICDNENGFLTWLEKLW